MVGKQFVSRGGMVRFVYVWVLYTEGEREAANLYCLGSIQGVSQDSLNPTAAKGTPCISAVWCAPL